MSNSTLLQEPQAKGILALPGCRPSPLSHYLKALGLFRIVAEQKDPSIHGAWQKNVFSLHGNLTQDELVSFLLNEYKPTSIVSPWNGGSGFGPKDNREAITKIENGESDRFDAYRKAIAICRQARETLGITEKAEKKKAELLMLCRNWLDEDSLAWFDAAVLLSNDDPKYPPLLGTGGNDGRLDFSNNYMQRLTELIDLDTGKPTPGSSDWLEQSLFEVITNKLQTNSPIGQFNPGSAGGMNSTSGFDANSLINPWDFVFMLEGALLFAAASVKRMEHNEPGTLSYPFCVRQSGVGYGSSATDDEKTSRAEMWLPVWDAPASLGEIQTVFSEGRARVGGRAVRNGVDFARAVASFGVDRGISRFERYGFQVRNGLAYFAVPLGSFIVHNNQHESLLRDFNDWHSRFRRAANAKGAPNRAAVTLRRLDSAMLDLCQQKSKKGGNASTMQLLDILTALGKADETLILSSRWREEVNLSPVPMLTYNWIDMIEKELSGQPEFDLAVALASIVDTPFYQHLGPIKTYRRGWASTTDGDIALKSVWHTGSLVDNLCTVVKRRLIDVRKQAKKEGDGKEKNESPLCFPDKACKTVSFEPINAFLDNTIDEIRLVELLRGLAIVKPQRSKSFGDDKPSGNESDKQGKENDALPTPSYEESKDEDEFPKVTDIRDPIPGADYALLKLCHHNWHQRPLKNASDEIVIPIEPSIFRRLSSGDLLGATSQARRHLRSHNLNPTILPMSGSPERAQRLAASMLFPISSISVKRLVRYVTNYDTDDNKK